MVFHDIVYIYIYIHTLYTFHTHTHVTSCDSLVLLIPSGKLTKNYGKSQFSMGKSTISMVIFNS